MIGVEYEDVVGQLGGYMTEGALVQQHKEYLFFQIKGGKANESKGISH